MPLQNISSLSLFQNFKHCTAGSCFFNVWYLFCPPRIHNKSRNVSRQVSL